MQHCAVRNILHTHRRWPTIQQACDGCPARLAAQRRLRTSILRHSSWDEDVRGDDDTQDTLVDLLRAEIQKETFKEEIRSDVKDKQEQLRKIGEDVSPGRMMRSASSFYGF